MQVADVVGPAFNLPEWTVRFLITILLIGFPFVVVVSWMYDLSGGHLERTESSR